MKKKEIKKVLKIAKDLIKKHTFVTTLEIKQALRQVYPNNKWFQSDISDVMAEAHEKQSIKRLDYSDNGTYRLYTRRAKSPTTLNKAFSLFFGTQAQPTVNQAPTVATGPQKLSRTAIVDLMKNSGGKFFTVIFTKVDGTERTINGQVKKDDFFDNLGYINFRESNGNYRKVNPKTIKEISISKQIYKVN